MAFSQRNIVGCLLKKGLQRGGHGHPRTPPPPPPPRYALAKIYTLTLGLLTCFEQRGPVGLLERKWSLQDPVYKGDFCRATQCNFCRPEVATRLRFHRDFSAICQCKRQCTFVCCILNRGDKFPKIALESRLVVYTCSILKLHRQCDKNCIELRDKNRLCKRALRK